MAGMANRRFRRSLAAFVLAIGASRAGFAEVIPNSGYTPSYYNDGWTAVPPPPSDDFGGAPPSGYTGSGSYGAPDYSQQGFGGGYGQGYGSKSYGYGGY